MYVPKDQTELRNILEALRIFTSHRGMTELSELLGDAEITLAMEDSLKERQAIDSNEDDEPASG